MNSLEIELNGLRQENQRLREMNEALLRSQFPERGEEKTLRDELAMAALPEVMSESPHPEYVGEDGVTSASYMAKSAYFMADAMLEARKK